MNTLIARISRPWTISRVLRLVIGIAIVGSGISDSSYPIMALGAVLILQGLFFGGCSCGSDSCSSDSQY